MSVRKREITTEIARRHEVTQAAVALIVNDFLDALIAEVSAKGRIELRGLGVFEVQERAARRRHNPRTKEKLVVPAHRVVKFSTGRRFHAAVNGVVESESPAEGPGGDEAAA